MSEWKTRLLGPGVCVALLVCSCRSETAETDLSDGRADEIRAHMSFLADDLLEGRAVGTRGYQLAARYVASQFEAIGLEPAGDEGSFYQNVPLREASIDNQQSSFMLHGKDNRALAIGEQVLIHPSSRRTELLIRGALILVGYGIVEDTLAHDDYDGLSVDGKLVVVFSGAPASFPSTERAVLSSLELKADEAARRGAVGLVVIRSPTDRARRAWKLATERAALPSMDWLAADGEPQRFPDGLDAIATLGDSTADALLARAGAELARLITDADAATARLELGVAASVRTISNHRDLNSPNVVARLPGTTRAEEHLVVSSHLDHLGIGPEVDGDSIYNGAYDNASGIAVLLTIARSLAAQERPQRSLIFLAATAEEKGLLGSDYFVRFPTVNRQSLAANINVDGALMFHPFLDFVPFGAAHSTIEASVEAAAQSLSLQISPDFMPEEVIFIRSDQYSFVRQGIPALYTFVGNETGNSVDGREQLRAWMEQAYHHPSDDMAQEMDFTAGAQYAELNRRITVLLANAEQRPRWKDGDFLGSRFDPESR